MVPPIFIDMLIFECVAGPRVSDGTAGHVPFDFTPWALVKGPPSLPRWLGTSCGSCFCDRVDIACNGSRFPCPSEDTPGMVILEQEKCQHRIGDREQTQRR